MTLLSFEVFARTDSDGERMTGTLADLLQHMPYLLVLGVIPPLEVVNDLLRRGINDAGMSGGVRWEPFEVDAAEWAEARAALEDGGAGYRLVQPPPWVADYEDWHSWLFEHLYGLPADEHRRLMRADAELARAIEQAVADDDKTAVLDLHMKRVRVGEELSTLLARHVRPASG